MTMPLRISIVTLLAAAFAVSLVGQDAPGADYPTPRPLHTRRPVAPEALPAAATDVPAKQLAPTAEAATKHPKIVRVDLQLPIEQNAPANVAPDQNSVAAPREFPAAAAIMPTPRTIARTMPHPDPQVGLTPFEAASPSDQTAPSVRLVTKNVSTSQSLPKVRVASTTVPATTTATAYQPPPVRDVFAPPSDADLKRWFTPLDQIGIVARGEPGEFPRDYSGDIFAVDDKPRRKKWPEREFNWEAPEVWHQPFYFEDVPLERYGQSLNPERQAWLSGLKFYMTFPLLPVKLWADPPFSKVATFGYYRAGSDNPAVRQKSILPYGYGPRGGGYWRGAGSFWDVPLTPAWETTPQ